MALLGKLLGRAGTDAAVPQAQFNDNQSEPLTDDESLVDLLRKRTLRLDESQRLHRPELDDTMAEVTGRVSPSDASDHQPAPPANIWDIDASTPPAPRFAPDVPQEPEIEQPTLESLAPEQADTALPELPETDASVAPTPVRKRRAKTRLLGFEHSSGQTKDALAAPDVAPSTSEISFPVGWIVVTEGPGRGASFPLLAGMSVIGRGTDQSIPLDFGDTAISRSTHAAIVYDAESRDFLLGHGGKSNIVRLNGAPVISNEPLSHGDLIKVGETTLRLVAFCGPSFDWAETTTDGGANVEIT